MGRASAAPESWAAETADDSADELITGEAVALSVRPAGFVLRAAGAAIDVAVHLGSYLALMVILFTSGAADMLDSAALTAISIAALVTSIVVIPMAVELLTSGRSLGRLAVGARIVRDDGGAIRFRHTLVRALSGVFELYLTLGGAAAIVALLDPRAKRIGDHLAGTYAQHERVPPPPAPPGFGVPVALQDWAATADVARIPDRLSRRIGQFLAQSAQLLPQTRARVASELAQEASPYVSPVPAADPELFLAAVTVLRRERDSAALAAEGRRLEGLSGALRALPHDFPDRG